MSASIPSASQLQGYRALTADAALLLRPDQGLVELTGSDRVDFVQRLTTNDVAGLQPGQAAVTVLTDPTARILFVFTVLQRGQTLELLPGPHQAEPLSRHLQGQIFFMDQVRVQERSTAFVRLRLMGPKAHEPLEQLGLPVPAAHGHFLEADDVRVVREERLEIPGFELVIPRERAEGIVQALARAGAAPVDVPTYEIRRVELGLGGYGHEFVADYTPLEVGLAWACSEHKGCYTGQEVIARQITYDKITRRLVQLHSSEPLPEGADLLAQGRKVGRITSSVHSLEREGPLALAVVRRPHHAPGTRLSLANGLEATVA